MNGPRRVLDCSVGVAGAYCAKVLADAGAALQHRRPPEGDPLERSSGALYRHLHLGARPVEGPVEDLVTGRDVVITSSPDDADRFRAADPALIVVTITPFGTSGPWRDRASTEFTLQAACGSIGDRGSVEDGPLAAGGQLGEWIAGTYAAVGALAASRRRRLTGAGAHVDVSMLDAMAVTMVTFPSVFAELADWPEPVGPPRFRETPSIEPTSDGYIVVTTNSAAQFSDFLVMIGHPDLLEDASLRIHANRVQRRDEFLALVHGWTRARTTAEVLEEAGVYRIPAGPVLNGATVTGFEHFAARNVFSLDPTGAYLRPRVPYRIGPDPDAPHLEPATREDPGPSTRPLAIAAAAGDPRGTGSARKGALPLEGIRVLDCTAWWAGPVAPHALGSLGAEVIKVESTGRPDLMRYTSTRPPTEDRWWEWGPLFHAVNTNKRGITLDLSVEAGREVFERLAATADVVVENYTPRVMEQFGLDWDRLHELNPALVMVRMPAFGLDGPWRDRTGFAQTMESITGLAWLTGKADGTPTLVRGACDPVSGMHATIATILALEERDATGEGRFVEVAMAEAALNVAAEQVIVASATGAILTRDGNRGPNAAPQGVYPADGTDAWIAVAVATDEHWRALCAVIGRNDWASDPALDHDEGRRAAHDRLDAGISAWSEALAPGDAVVRLQGAGVPAEVVVRPRDIISNPQLLARGLFEVEHHPITGDRRIPTLPMRVTGIDQWLRSPAPTLGEHNHEVLAEVGVTDERIEDLRQAGIIGERPAGT